eukprot:10944211-Karenia_brevis.AAC.1
MLAATTVMVQPCPPPLVWHHSCETQFLILKRWVKAPYMLTRVGKTGALNPSASASSAMNGR